MDLERDYERLSTLEFSIQKQSEEADELLTSMRNRIRHGETTGDPIKDHIILIHGFDQELIEILNDLLADLQKHEGEAVLVIKRFWEKIVRNPKDNQPVYELRRSLYLTVSTTPFLRFHQEQFDDIELVSLSHYTCWEKLHPKDIRHVFSPLFLFSGTLYKVLTEPMQADITYLHQTDREKEIVTEVIIGDEQVNNWFREEAQFTDMPPQHRTVVQDKSGSLKVKRELVVDWFNPAVLSAYELMRTRLGLKSTIESTQVST